jgi:hypothetical protein
MVLNYQASQPTGWGQMTLGDHTTPLTFNDGTGNGRTYQISTLPFGQVAAKPDPVYENQPTKATINFTTTFNAAFGASYVLVNQGGFAGQNEFNVQSYSVFANNGGQVGEDIYIFYSPDKGDPPINANLHWIQVIWNNWSSTPPDKNTTGVVENIVDNGGAAVPYYDSPLGKGAAGITTINGAQVFNFYDKPGRPSSELAAYGFATPIQWMAEDFLVVDTGMKNGDNKEILNVFGGIEYGWQVVPEPSSMVLVVLGLGTLAPRILRGRPRAESARARRCG